MTHTPLTPSAPRGILAQLAADAAFYRTQFPGSPWVHRMFWVCATYRIGHWATRLRVPIVGHLLRLAYFVLNFIVSTITDADIRPGAVIGQCFCVHTCRGLLITNGVQIGDDCMVNAQVCIVNAANDRGQGVPAIGSHVRIGIGAKVMGGIRIGDHARVGANAVVIRDVPGGHLAVGVPAALKPRKDLDPALVEHV